MVWNLRGAAVRPMAAMRAHLLALLCLLLAIVARAQRRPPPQVRMAALSGCRRTRTLDEAIGCQDEAAVVAGNLISAWTLESFPIQGGRRLSSTLIREMRWIEYQCDHFRGDYVHELCDL